MLYRHIRLTIIALLGLALYHPVEAAKGDEHVSFRMEDGLILLHLQVNDRPGWFIFDTGAPGLVLNAEYYRSEIQKEAQVELVGIHGQVESVSQIDWHLKLNDFERTGREALVCDLTYLENNRNEQILGLIGLDVFQGYYVSICYESHTFSISRSLSLPSESFQKIPIVRKENLCTVEIDAGSKKVCLIVDTGSESNIIDESVISHPNFPAKKIGEKELVGGDGNIILTDEVTIPLITLRNEKLPNQIFLVSQLGSLNKTGEVKVHGILGRPFFGSRQIIFDRMSRYLYITEDTRENGSDLIRDESVVLTVE